MKCDFVDAEKAAFPIRRLCKVLELSPKTYYARRSRAKSARALGDEQLLVLIRAVFEESRETYGSPRVHAALAADDVRVGRKRVARLMRQAGLAVRPKRGFRCTTTVRDPEHSVAPNTLDRQFSVKALNVAWVTDVTYIPTDEGWLYLATIIDLFNREVVGYAMSSTNDQLLTAKALRLALAEHQPPAGMIHHSDRGSTYTAGDYRDLLADNGIECSMSRKGDCWDNSVPRTPGWRCSESDESVASRTLVAGPGFKPRRAAEVKSLGGERRRKRHRERCQVRNRKTNVSEPLMTRRKAIYPTSKPGGVVAPGRVRTRPAYGPGGVRRGGGVILFQALSGNVGTCRLDDKGELRGSRPSEDKSTDARHRGGAARSSDEVPEKAWSKGAALFGRACAPTRLGRSA